MTKGPVISKSKYLSGKQCLKFLWYQYHDKKAIPPHGLATLLSFDEGKKVGALAQRLYPEGVKVPWHHDPSKVMLSTISALLKKKPIFEAGFINDPAYALTDILLPVEGGAWDIIEVKSAMEMKEEYYHDAAFQKYAAEGAGITIRKVFLMFINREFEKHGPIDPEKFFRKVEITERIEPLIAGIKDDLKGMLETLSQREAPDVKIGQHCTSPRECPLKEMCWSVLPDDHVFLLFRQGKLGFELYEKGILKLSDIPADAGLSDKQTMQVESHGKKEAHVDKESIRNFLSELKHPLYYLDFETVAPAVPVYDGTRPYQDIPFQFSLHVVEKPGAKPRHLEYLAPDEKDPRPEVLRRLKTELGSKGSIVAYFAPYEQKCLETSAAAYPEYQEWASSLKDRFVDLLVPFRSFFYYHPDQGGSASMKKVLPAITGISYDDLEIGQGGDARAEFSRVTFNENITAEDRAQVRRALIEYCGQDTLGMVKIVEALTKVAEV